jgi:hypothetical protein
MSVDSLPGNVRWKEAENVAGFGKRALICCKEISQALVRSINAIANSSKLSRSTMVNLVAVVD